MIEKIKNRIKIEDLLGENGSNIIVNNDIEPFIKVSKYIFSLNYEELPDYEWIKSQFKNV